MGFALLFQLTGEEKYYVQAVHFLSILEKTRCRGYRNFCWGYPFDWVTRNGVMAAGTPLITTTPYVYEAFSYVYQIDKKERWLEIMHSAAEHAANDIKDREISADTATAGYNPFDTEGGVINASAYRAFLLYERCRCNSDAMISGLSPNATSTLFSGHSRPTAPGFTPPTESGISLITFIPALFSRLSLRSKNWLAMRDAAMRSRQAWITTSAIFSTITVCRNLFPEPPD